MAIRIKFDPESAGYDYRSARAAGIKSDKTGHWPSRVASGPQEGLLLKGRKHKTWHLTETAEKEAGYRIYKKNGRYYSVKKPIKRAKIMNPKLRKKATYRLGPKGKGPKTDAVVNELVAQWAGKDLQPWLAQAGKDYPELRGSYQLGAAFPTAVGPSTYKPGIRTPSPPVASTTPPPPVAPGSQQAPVEDSWVGLQGIGTQMETRYGEFKDWLGTQREDVEGAAGRAGADVAGQAEIARQSEARRMMGMGIDPTSGRFGALSRRSVLDEARNKAAAMTRARGAERQRATGIRMAGEAQLTGMMGQRAGVAGEIAGLRDVGAGREWSSREAELARQGVFGEAARARAWARGERTGSEAAATAAAEVGREWQTGERTRSETAAAEAAEAAREWQTGQTEAQQTWQREETIRGETEIERLRAAERERQRIAAAKAKDAAKRATSTEMETIAGPGGSTYTRPVGWGMKKGGPVSPNIYKVGEGGTKKRPRSEVYISDSGAAEEVGKRGPEVISVRESGLIVPHPKTVKEMKGRKCGGRVKGRQLGGRVSPGGRGIPENIMKAIGKIKGRYDAKITGMLAAIGQGRIRRPGSARGIPTTDLTDPYKRIRAIEKLKQSQLAEIGKYYGIRPGMVKGIPAVHQGYREGRHVASRGTRKEMLERAITQEQKEFDPNYPATQ